MGWGREAWDHPRDRFDLRPKAEESGWSYGWCWEVVGSSGLEWQGKSDPKGPDHARLRGLPLYHSVYSKYTLHFWNCALSSLIEWVISICDLQLKMCRSFIHHIIQIDSLWFTVTFLFQSMQAQHKIVSFNSCHERQGILKLCLAFPCPDPYYPLWII